MPPWASYSDEVVLGACLPSISSLLLTSSELAWPEREAACARPCCKYPVVQPLALQPPSFCIVRVGAGQHQRIWMRVCSHASGYSDAVHLHAGMRVDPDLNAQSRMGHYRSLALVDFTDDLVVPAPSALETPVRRVQGMWVDRLRAR